MTHRRVLNSPRLFLPIAVVGTLGALSLVLEDPIGLGHPVRFTIAFLLLTLVFFACFSPR